MMRFANRRALTSALDSLIGWMPSKGWVGTIGEVREEAKKQGHTHLSDYVIRKYLQERGKALGKGQYKVLRKDLT